jgi:cell division protein FtsQ
MPKPRATEPRRKRRLAWPFGQRQNRRVRSATHPSLPAVGREPSAKIETPRPPSSGHGRRLLVALLLLLSVGGAAFGGHRYVTRSRHFAVRVLKFSSLKHASEDALGVRAGVALGSNLFAVDLAEVARDVAQEPWVLTARARRELPSTIMVDVVEREPACVVAFGALYLADAKGQVFKRANPDEAASLPTVTGVERDAYLSDPETARAQIREAVAVIGAWHAVKARPPLGEVHLDRLNGATLYTATGGVGVRLGRVDETLMARLQRFDAVWAALEESGEHPRLIYLDNRARPDRVTVKLAVPPKPVDGNKKSES